MSGIYWLASYPRSGNTWMRLVLQSCLAGGADVDINALAFARMNGQSRHHFDEAIGVSAADLTPEEVLAWRPAAIRGRAAALEHPLYAKTHDARIVLPNGETLIPAEAALGAIYLVRDPRDVVLSLSRFLNLGLDDTIALMAKADCQMGVSRRRLLSSLSDYWGSWSLNVESWLDGPGIRPHVVRYEDFRADPARALTGVLPALGLDVSAEAAEAALASARLENLRAQEAQGRFREGSRTQAFFGRGQVGAWRDQLSARQAARIEADHGPMMRRLGYLS